MRIKLERLKVFGYHGVLEREKQDGQEFFLDISFDYASPNSDNILCAVNYAEVAEYAVAEFSKIKYDLIESVAESLAKMILDSFGLVQSVEVTVGKPNAPIPHPFLNVTATAARGWTRCFLSLGSNLGNRRSFLDGAVRNLPRRGIRVCTVSSIIETKPYGVLDQDDFLNSCVELETYLTPKELLDVCMELENGAGRVKTRHWGERTLDVDILLFGDKIIAERDLTIPHIDMTEREFVLAPLAEIAPGVVHPICRKTSKSLLEELRQRGRFT